MRLKPKSVCLFLVLFSLSVAGCSAKYHQQVVDQPRASLQTGEGVFICVPEDGFYGSQKYPQSGEMTAQALEGAFAPYTHRIEVSDQCRGEDCLDRIPPETYAYYASPEILHWEERATEWSGRPDQIRIKIVIYDVDGRDVLSSVIIQGRSKWATFGGDHPQDLLAEPFSRYLNTLYGGR
jgi:hypothetical protein